MTSYSKLVASRANLESEYVKKIEQEKIQEQLQSKEDSGDGFDQVLRPLCFALLILKGEERCRSDESPLLGPRDGQL